MTAGLLTQQEWRVRIGRWIEQERRKRRWSQPELASRMRAAGWPACVNTVGKWEHGHVTPPGYSLYVLERLFGVEGPPDEVRA